MCVYSKREKISVVNDDVLYIRVNIKVRIILIALGENI